MRYRLLSSVACAVAVAAFVVISTQAQDTPTPVPPDRTGAVADLAHKLERGEVKLDYRDPWGYLPSLLEKLDVPIDSQVLVFSKTSLQQERIGPKTPRALYFNDTIAVGAVQNGALFEITSTDPTLGIAFYTLDVRRVESPRIEPDRSLCIMCHNYTWAPHTFVATVYPNAEGSPAFLGGDDLFRATDHTSPFEDRWGGWYVSGTHGTMKHLGNAVALNPYRPVELETKNTQNQKDLSAKFDVKKYLAPSSDLIALMTLEHQTRAHYLISSLSAQFRSAAANDLPLAKRPTPASLAAAVEKLVTYLTFADEIQLTSPVQGVSTFTQTFPQRGPRDPQGRSLRDFDLKTRIFRYPLSYTIYTDIFDQMHPKALEQVYRRLYEVLSGQDKSPKFAKRTPESRRAALEILRATKPTLPDYWRATP
ncbi:MAG: hypothetical protein ABI811_06935 [Acidobacteriota bacterium]